MEKITFYNLLKFGFLLLSFLFLAYLVRRPIPKQSPTSHLSLPAPSYHYSCPLSKTAYESPADSALAQQVQGLTTSNRSTQALILPHHLLAKDLINETLNLLTQDYQTIIILGPNHLNLGKEAVQTTLLNWQTKFGILAVDSKLIGLLALNNLATINQDNFNLEHSVCGLTSFIKQRFPAAKLVPLILKTNTTADQSKKLAEFLAKNCSNCLLIASTDFSHEVPQAQAQLNDQQSIEVLTNLQAENLNLVTNDSLPVLQTLFDFLSTKGISQGELINQSDSYTISQVSPDSVTSYLTIVY